MALPATENFTGTGALSGSWTVQTGNPKRASDVGAGDASVDNEAYWNADAFDSGHYAQAVLGGVFVGASVSVRCSGTAGARESIQANVSGTTQINVYDVAGGAYNVITTRSVTTLVGGETLRIEVTGDTAKVLINSVQQGADIDISAAGVSGGSAGWGVFDTGLIDNWEGGNLAAATRPMFRGQA